MTLVYVGLVLLLLFAVIDLITGLTNDAVNFLNSAIGARVANRRTIYWIASLGIVVGVFLSAGLMEVARKEVIYPQNFLFSELIVMFLAVMIADIVLIDSYNNLGLPTSTTVALVFELLGGALAIGFIRNASEDLTSIPLGELINADRTFLILTGISVSIFISFVVGAVTQFFARQIFTFQYENRYKFLLSLAGGLSITSILLLIIKKALLLSPFLVGDTQVFLEQNLFEILVLILVFSTLLFLFLGWALDVSIPSLVVMFGTFSLALAFAANDLVNFIGLPLTAWEVFRQFLDSPMELPNQFALQFLGNNTLSHAFSLGAWALIFFVSALVMVVTLFYSRKQRYVTETSVMLASQSAGSERFEASYLSRILVRNFIQAYEAVRSSIPRPLLRVISSRYEPRAEESRVHKKEPVYFDSLRAAVNLVVSAVLISAGTLLNFPLSTTFVVFMVAMGTAIADQAWGRESAVYRVSGMLTVVGSWLVSGVLALMGGLLLTLFFYYGGLPAIVAGTIGLAFYLYYSTRFFRKKQLQKEMFTQAASQEVVDLNPVADVNSDQVRRLMLEGTKIYMLCLDGVVTERLHQIQESRQKSVWLVDQVSKLKRTLFVQFVALPEEKIDAGQYLVQSVDYLSEYASCLQLMCDQVHVHFINNHKGLEPDQHSDFGHLLDEVSNRFSQLVYLLREKKFGQLTVYIEQHNELLLLVEEYRMKQLRRIKRGEGHTRINILMMELLAISRNLLLYALNIAKSQRDYSQSSK